MKNLLLVLLILPLTVFGQFGFERSFDIEVSKNSVIQKYAWVGGLDYCNFSNIDLNQDGKLDLFIFDKSGSKPLTFIQNGSEGVMDFEYAPQYEKAFPKLYGWTLLVDYDGDGKRDVYTSSPGGASVYKNISTATGGLEFTLTKEWLPTIYIYSSGDTIPTYVNVGQGDLPAISDVDNDGDVDILAFYFNNNCIRYYKNLSQELYGHSDSLTFHTVNICYGNIREDNASNQILLNSCCGTQVYNSENTGPPRPGQQSSDRHAGSCLLSFDEDADGMEELLISDIAYNSIVRMQNGSTVPNTNIDLIAPDYAFPSYNTPVDLPIFPAPSHVDVNNDGNRDLVVSPNLPLNSQNYRGTWMYLNGDADNNPDFDFQTTGFLQGDMIDGGSESYPIYFDHNGDGLKDLIVAISDRFDSISLDGYSQLLYYENVGTAALPKFDLITEDYMGLSTFNNTRHLFYRPAFGDADGDGDEDLLLSDYNDTMYYFENSAGAGNIAQFINPAPFVNNLGQIVDEGIQTSPKFVDLDRDGKQDLVIGKRTGQLAYYRNIGVGNTFSFEFITGSLGGVDVSEFWTTDGVATPEFIDIDNEWHLICGARNGYLHYYNNIDNNLSGNFSAIDSTLNDVNQEIYVGTYSAPAVLDIDGDNKLEMLVGNKRGGLAYYKSALITDVGLVENAKLQEINIYPNPTNNQFFIDLSQIALGAIENVTYSLHDISGKTVIDGQISSSKTIVDVKHLSDGVYFLSSNVKGQIESRKSVID